MFPTLKPRARVGGCQHSSFAATLPLATSARPAGPAFGRKIVLRVESLRQCQLTGKKANNGYTVSFSHIRNKTKQEVNLLYKRVFWPERQRWVRLRVSAKALKTIEKKGLQAMAKEIGLDLEKLPYEDRRKARTQWLAKQPKYPPQPREWLGKSRRMKNPEKLAASKKKPNVVRYFIGGREIITRDPQYVEEYRD